MLPNSDRCPLRVVFHHALPLVISSGSFAFKLFCDRLMMAWYADRSIGASVSAGMTSFMTLAFFMGISGYCTTFVAQYYGAERPRRIGIAVWQTLLFSLVSAVIILAASHKLAPFFSLIGHAPELAAEEEAYFRALAVGPVFVLCHVGLSGFWNGRGRIWTVVAVGVASIFLNIAANWMLIFGAAGCTRLDATIFAPLGELLNALAAACDAPQWGIMGAGLATVGTDAFSMLVLLVLFLRRTNRMMFDTWPKQTLDWDLMRRMIRHGSGNGLQMLFDGGSFAVFNLLIGTYGLTAEGANVGAASSIAFSVNSTSYIPLAGLGMTASILVGNGIGAGKIRYAESAVSGTRLIVLTYALCVACAFFFLPEQLVGLFGHGQVLHPSTAELARTFLRIAALFCVSDAVFLLYNSAVRGAGDTKFSACATAINGWLLFALPCCIARWYGAGFFVLWTILVACTALIAVVFWLRYRSGKWKTMRVIESRPET